MTTEVKADEEGLVQMKAIVLKIQSVRFYYNYNYTRRDSTYYGATSNNNSTSFLPVPF